MFGPSGELQPDPTWHFDAYPFPWEARLAFDHSPVTRWDAWQEIRKGARLEVDLGKAEPVSTVRVETKVDQTPVQWVLLGKNAAGNWFPLQQRIAEEISAPPLDLRSAAIQEFKRGNVRYILANAPPFAREFREHQSLWGIRRLAEFGNAQLYCIE